MARLDFETTKDLYEAGFPQESAKPEIFFDEDGMRVVRYPSLPFPRIGAYRSPGLGTLIEACGRDLQALTQQDDGWRANGVNGSTPEIAVARFWISVFGVKLSPSKVG